MTFPEIVESKDLLCGRTCAVDNVGARRKGVLGKLYEIQISPERGLRNSLKFPSYFGMEYVRPWNMGKKLLDLYTFLSLYVIIYVHIYIYMYIYIYSKNRLIYIYIHILRYIYIYDPMLISIIRPRFLSVTQDQLQLTMARLSQHRHRAMSGGETKPNGTPVCV